MVNKCYFKNIGIPKDPKGRRFTTNFRET